MKVTLSIVYYTAILHESYYVAWTHSFL